MWKGILGTGGFVAGCVVAGSVVQFAEFWLVCLAGLMGGGAGLLLGMAIDARRVTRPVVLGLLGFILGAPLGGALVWLAASFHDTFSGGGLAGIFLGVPLGAVLGGALGIWAGQPGSRN